jgi:hypothetical protein
VPVTFKSAAEHIGYDATAGSARHLRYEEIRKVSAVVRIAGIRALM